MLQTKALIGLIGGSGFYDFFKQAEAEELEIDTDYGRPSDKITVGDIAGKKVAFLPRHGKNHSYPPHQIPYKANVAALKKLGVETIIAPSAVGSLREEIKPGDFVFCDQFVDRTRGRADTFFNGPQVAHIETDQPYCPALRKIGYEQAQNLSLPVHKKGTVVVIEGPRFSTLAESLWFSKMGWDLVNMTQYPEVALALEMGMCYLNISLVTDYDVGVYSQGKTAPVTIEMVLENFKKNTGKLKELILEIISHLPESKGCGCQKKIERAKL